MLRLVEETLTAVRQETETQRLSASVDDRNETYLDDACVLSG